MCYPKKDKKNINWNHITENFLQLLHDPILVLTRLTDTPILSLVFLDKMLFIYVGLTALFSQGGTGSKFPAISKLTQRDNGLRTEKYDWLYSEP